MNMTSKIITIGLFFFISFGTAHAEQRPLAGSATNWVRDLGQAGFSDAGGFFLPVSVLDGMRSGSLSPIMQLSMVSHTINECTRRAISNAPEQRVSYVVGMATFTWGVCLMSSCLKNMMLLQLLPLLSDKYGTKADQDSARIQGALLSKAFQAQEGCNGAGDSGIDPLLVSAFQ